jgi:DNA-binding protein H-NS
VREWEYRKLYLNQHSPRGDDLELLNAAGTTGWELVGITGHNVAYLKREAGEPDRMAAVASGTAQAHGTNGGEVVHQERVVKYRDPATSETWSGRGRMPNWLKRRQEAGEDIEEYLV